MKDLQEKLLMPVLEHLSKEPIVITSGFEPITQACAELAIREWAIESWDPVVSTTTTWTITDKGRKALKDPWYPPEIRGVRCTKLEFRDGDTYMVMTATFERELLVKEPFDHPYRVGHIYFLDR